MFYPHMEPYLRRAAHHQLYEVPAASFGCVDVSYGLQTLQGAVLGEAADQHGSLGPFGHPARPSHLLAVGHRRVSLVQVRDPDHRRRLSPPPLPQLHLPSSNSSTAGCLCAGLIILGGGCWLLISVGLFVIVQTGGCWEIIRHFVCHWDAFVCGNRLWEECFPWSCCCETQSIQPALF